MIGRRFGRLTVIRLEGVRPSKRGRAEFIRMWRCKCVCGNERVVVHSDLNSGRARSCGCVKKPNPFTPEMDQMLKDFYPEFGKVKTAEAIWNALKVNVSAMRVKHRANYLGLRYQTGRPGRRVGTKSAVRLEQEEALFRASVTPNAYICQPWTQGARISGSPEIRLYSEPESVSRMVDYHRVLRAIVDERRESIHHARWAR